MKQIISTLVLAGILSNVFLLTSGQPPFGSRPAGYAPISNQVPVPSYTGGFQQEAYEEPHKDYAFGYNIQELDEYGNPNVHSRTEAREGAIIKGQYTVVLPDCTTQIVDYYVDEYQQYHADVKYEGVPCPEAIVEKKPQPGYGRGQVATFQPGQASNALSGFGSSQTFQGLPFRR